MRRTTPTEPEKYSARHTARLEDSQRNCWRLRWCSERSWAEAPQPTTAGTGTRAPVRDSYKAFVWVPERFAAEPNHGQSPHARHKIGQVPRSDAGIATSRCAPALHSPQRRLYGGLTSYPLY
ncbi:hypothetical protein CCMA1212_001998 [Trichoderma ghanense]|uniref:Uncharacterized protein n=1 Tax=Trichoderma ghanense TaxID=65468 RepID=A0ABY2HD89_9HYPO